MTHTNPIPIGSSTAQPAELQTLRDAHNVIEEYENTVIESAAAEERVGDLASDPNTENK